MKPMQSLESILREQGADCVELLDARDATIATLCAQVKTMQMTLEAAPYPTDWICSKDYRPWYNDTRTPALAGLPAPENDAAGLVEAVRPFCDPEFSRILGGNEQGDESPVYSRNFATLTIGDFRKIAAALAAYEAERK